MNKHTQSVSQRGVVIAFAGVVAVLIGTVLARFPSGPASADLLSGSLGMRQADSSAAALADVDPNTVVVVVTDDDGNNVITYTEAQLDAAVQQESLLDETEGQEQSVGGMPLQDGSVASPDDGTELISTGTCKDQTLPLTRTFTAAAGPKGSKRYSYCTEKTMKDVLNEHMDGAVTTFCGNFTANKYVAQCADGCMQADGADSAGGTFKEKARTFDIKQVDDKTCKVVTGNSVAYTGSASLQGVCTLFRKCVPFKSKFKQY